MMSTERQGHGWWPYVVPYLAYMGTLEIVRRLPDEWGFVELLLKPVVPGALMLYFFARGAYPELRGRALGLGGRAADMLLGVALAVLWMAPFVGIEALRPADPELFDPSQLGPDRVAWVLGLRMLGYGLVTPFFEEIFIRGFVMRYADVYSTRGDFRDVPLARFRWTSFLATVVIFTVTHVPWEWWVAVPWIVLTNLWFYYRKDLYAVILVHAVTNASILAAAILWGDTFTDASGNPFSLWLFV